MTKFRLVASRHFDLSKPPKKRHDMSGVPTYSRGDIVESADDLMVKFPGKFERYVEQAEAHVLTEERKVAAAALIDAGHWTEDDREFLHSLSDPDFNRIARRAEAEPAAKAKGVASILGEDVTEAFPVAVDNNLKVFKNAAGKHQITRPNNTKKPINKEALDEAAVNAFVEDFVKE